MPETTQLLVREVGLESELPVRLDPSTFRHSSIYLQTHSCWVRLWRGLLQEGTRPGRVWGLTQRKEHVFLTSAKEGTLCTSYCPLETNVAQLQKHTFPPVTYKHSDISYIFIHKGQRV